MNINRWLEAQGLGQYAELFRSNHIDNELLPQLTADDLKKIGVASLGHRKKLIEAIAALAREAKVPVPVPARERSNGLPERRQLTVMFVDLVGSTALSKRLDPEEMREVILAYQNAVAGEVSRFGGHISQFLGDGVLAYFGWPRAHEEDAERSVRAGLAITVAVSRLKVPAGRELQTRIGIATGVVVVGDLIDEGQAKRHAVVGDTPNLAARLQGVAEPGAIVIAKSTRDLLGNLFVLRELATQNLKGISEPISAFAVIAEQNVESRFAARHAGDVAPMVGRDQELALLVDCWHKAKSGEGQMVLVSGEAGIGKSRLTEAVVDAIRGEAHVLLRCQCSPYHADTALYPVIQQILQAAGLKEDAGDAEERLDRLEAFLDTGAGVSAEAVTLIGAMVGVDTSSRYDALALAPQQRRARTLTAFIDHLAERSRRAPLIWLIEDGHWIDPTTLELVQLATNRLATLPILAIITTRPPGIVLPESDLSSTRLELGRLDRAAIRAIVSHISNGKGLPELLFERVTAATDGVPLFVEESTKALLESGMLRETATTWQLVAPLANLTIPSSLHDSLMARLDRLPPDVKEVAQSAAVIGREFDRVTLAEISPLPAGELFHALDRLVEAELVFCPEQPTDGKYLFKHALVRDAAYESLLKSSRRSLHLHLLDVMEASPDVAPEVLAHHAHEGGAIAKAVGYWRQAAEAASQRYAHREAAALYALALDAPQDLAPEVRASMLEACAWQDYVADSVSVSVARHEQALQIWKALGRTLDQGRVMSRLSRAYWNRCRGDECRRTTYEAVALLQGFPESLEYLEALCEVTRIEMLAGNNLAVFEVGSRALAMAERRGDEKLVAQLLNNIGTARCQSGELEVGIATLKRSVDIARKNRDEDSIGRFYINLAYQLVEHRRYEEAERLIEECARQFHAGEDSDLYYWQGTAWRAQIDLALGRWDEAEAEARRALARYQPSAALPFRIHSLLFLARIGSLRGKPDAEAFLNEASDLAARTREPLRIAPAAYVRCEMLWLADLGLRERSGEMRSYFDWFKRLHRQTFVNELGYWLWRLGETVDGIDPASPRGLQIAGSWREAAEAWRRIGCPLEEGQSLLDGDREAVAGAVRIFERLGAVPYLAKARLGLERGRRQSLTPDGVKVSGS
jgi:class 3 adenylate cyclase/tetratricopeptide (TPR) repeat protein